MTQMLRTRFYNSQRGGGGGGGGEEEGEGEEKCPQGPFSAP